MSRRRSLLIIKIRSIIFRFSSMFSIAIIILKDRSIVLRMKHSSCSTYFARMLAFTRISTLDENQSNDFISMKVYSSKISPFYSTCFTKEKNNLFFSSSIHHRLILFSFCCFAFAFISFKCICNLPIDREYVGFFSLVD